MPGAIRSSKWLMRLMNKEEMHKNTREAKGKLEVHQTPHGMLLSPVDTVHGPAFTAIGS